MRVKFLLTVVLAAGLLAGAAGCGKKEAPEEAKAPAPPVETAVDRAAFAEDCFVDIESNFVAAMKLHKKNLDAVAKMDPETDEISDEQRDSVRAVRDAQVIDGALSVLETARTAKTGSFTAAYELYAKRMEAVAKKSWKTKDVEQEDAEILQKILLARMIDTATAYRNAAAKITTGNFAVAYAQNAKKIESLAGKNWKTGEMSGAETSAFEKVQTAYEIDLAAALLEVRKTASLGPFQSAYDKSSSEIEALANGKLDKKAPENKGEVLCGVMAAYREEQKTKAGHK
jgi:hypothetical protein